MKKRYKNLALKMMNQNNLQNSKQLHNIVSSFKMEHLQILSRMKIIILDCQLTLKMIKPCKKKMRNQDLDKQFQWKIPKNKNVKMN